MSIVAVALTGVFACSGAAQDPPSIHGSREQTLASYERAVENDHGRVQAAQAQLQNDRRIYGSGSWQAKQDEITLDAMRATQHNDKKVLDSAQSARVHVKSAPERHDTPAAAGRMAMQTRN